MKKKILIVLAVVLLASALMLVFAGRSSRNTAKAEAQTVLGGFAAATSSQWYCENGYGKGIDNQTPWWEEIYLSDIPADETVKRVVAYLQTQGYEVDSRYIENSRDWYNAGKTYWEIRGANDSHKVAAAVSARELTLNNCFPGFTWMNETLKPESYASNIVIHFRTKPD